jgi:hypothetical protein
MEWKKIDSKRSRSSEIRALVVAAGALAVHDVWAADEQADE